MSELHWLTLTQAAEKLRSRELGAVELTKHMLDRIAALDPTLKAYVVVAPERAIERARAAEAEIAAGNYRGPLHGVPIAVKDLCYTTWAPTAAGTTILRDFMADENATVVNRLEDAGAIIIGKLQLTEGAYGTHHPDIELPVNPWDAGRWTGVSSSGSGVATAAGMCFASLGSDTGGSIRFPSAMCGVVGIKPTWGRVSRHAVFPLGLSLDHIGPMTRSVADAAAVLQVIAGRDDNDPTSLPAPVPDYLAALHNGVHGLRIGFDERYCTESMDPEVANLVLKTRGIFERAGAQVVPVTIPWKDEMSNDWNNVCAVETALCHEKYYPERKDEYGRPFAAFIEVGRSIDPVELARAWECRRQFNGALAAIFQDVDLVLSPSYGLKVPPAERVPQERNTLGHGMRFTAPFDFSGSPTISIPCGFASDGMPASLQLVGRHLGEETLVAAGHLYETATEWHNRRPPLAT